MPTGSSISSLNAAFVAPSLSLLAVSAVVSSDLATLSALVLSSLLSASLAVGLELLPSVSNSNDGGGATALY